MEGAIAVHQQAWNTLAAFCLDLAENPNATDLPNELKRALSDPYDDLNFQIAYTKQRVYARVNPET